MMEPQRYREKAKEMYHDEGTIEIDPDADVSMPIEGDEASGAYVMAWVWVEDDEEKLGPDWDMLHKTMGDKVKP